MSGTGSSYSSGVFSVAGTGCCLARGGPDRFQFAYQPLSGDGTIIARLVSEQNVVNTAKAGLMMRETLADNAPYGFVGLIGGTPLTVFQQRWTTGGEAPGWNHNAVSLPYWFKLVRSGNTITGYGSSNGANWVQLDYPLTSTLGSTIYVGLAVGSDTSGQVTTATFDNVLVLNGAGSPDYYLGSDPAAVSVTSGGTVSYPKLWVNGVSGFAGNVQLSASGLPSGVGVSFSPSSVTGSGWSVMTLSTDATTPVGSYPITVTGTSGGLQRTTSVLLTVNSTGLSLPSPWANQDIGQGISGTGSSYSGGVFSVAGTGCCLARGGPDRFQFAYQPLSGDGTIIARLVSEQNVVNTAKAGLMMRETLADNSSYGFVGVIGGTPLTVFQQRWTTGGEASDWNHGAVSLPYWFKLVRSGNTITGYGSSNGANWVQLDYPLTSTLGSTIYVGLAVGSDTSGQVTTATFDNVSGVSIIPGAVPTLTSASPNTGTQGTSVPVTLTGTNFASGATVAVSNPGVTVSNVVMVNATQITATLSIAANATVGTANVSVTTAGGTSGTVSFSITAATPAPTLTSVTPNTGVQGTSVSVTLTGANFVSGATVAVSNPGVTVSNVVVVSATQITAMLSIASNATVGTANLSVTTAGGTSGMAVFTIAQSVGFVPIRVNAAGPAYIDSEGRLWSASNGFNGGSGFGVSPPAGINVPVIYQTGLYNNSPFEYSAPLPNGQYQVTLKFADSMWCAPDDYFSVVINGSTVASWLNPYGAVGAASPWDATYPITISDGHITIAFRPDRGYAVINAIQILAANAVEVLPHDPALGAGQIMQFSTNITGQSGQEVTWTINPSLGTISSTGVYTAPASVATATQVTITATSVDNPSVRGSSTVSLIPNSASAFVPIRINAGGPAYMDPQGRLWNASNGFSGGSGFSFNPAGASNVPVIYRTGMEGNFPFQYQASVPNGQYWVTLAFADSLWSVSGDDFNIVINGVTREWHLSLYTLVGAAMPWSAMYPVNVTDGQITIMLQPHNGNAVINGIEIVAASSVEVLPGNPALDAGQVMQFTANIPGQVNQAVTWTIDPNVGAISNEDGLYTAPSSATATQVTVTATSVAAPSLSGRSTISLNSVSASAFVPIRVNAGGPAYTDPQGVSWSASNGFSGGIPFAFTPAPGANVPVVYQTGLTSNTSPFQYQTTVPNGQYLVTLKFADSVYDATYDVFDIIINGITRQYHLSLYGLVGLASPWDTTVPVNVTDGQITVVFQPFSHSAVINAIQIVAAGSIPAPVISGLSPNSGAVGTAVTIAGTGFGAMQGGSIVTFNGTKAGAATSWSATSITINVPGGATTGKVVVIVDGAASNEAAFAVTVTPPAPTITGLSPNSGPIGTAVTITGTNFGSSQGSSTVTFNGASAGTASSWSATSITVNIPSGATTGSVVVTVGGVVSSGTALFTVAPPAPTLTTVSPSSGAQGTSVPVTLAGTNFVSGANVAVSNPGVTVSNVVVVSAAQITATLSIAANATVGTANVSVTTAGGTSGTANFTITAGTPPPTLTAVSPNTGAQGTSVPVALSGTNFVSGATVAVSNPGVTVSNVVVVSAAQITATLSIGANAAVGTANVSVTTTGGTSGTVNFTITAATPTLTLVTPNTGTQGRSVPVTLTGTNFVSGASVAVSNPGVTVNNAVVVSATQITATLSIASAAAVGNANVSVTTAGGTTGTVVFTVLPVPTISGLSQTTCAGGAQIVISGSGFGATQGTGAVWLGSNYATVVSWSDTQVTAVVASNSQSGTARIRQGGVWSNAVALSVTTATIANVTPASALPGTLVTITGTGFGATQGSGQVWLGTASGTVQSWNDTQVTALVAVGAMSGNAQVLQNGVMSNAVAFTVPVLHISALSPSSGIAGTSVTITGTGFGSSQGTGTVILGSKGAQVVTWSETQVVAVVAADSVTGVARVQQNGAWSNALTFTVPPSSGNSLTLEPNILTLLTGETHAVQAVNSAGQAVTGLTWTSSDPAIATITGDPSPLLTAVAPGHVTITAGSASADVTVLADSLPLGTVLWSNPGNGSGVSRIVPAVPSPTGVADVFAVQNDGTVQAITSEGKTAWTVDVSDCWTSDCLLPDFQGGLVAVRDHQSNGRYSIGKFDGITGQAYPEYLPGSASRLNGKVVVHTDGTVFAVQRNWASNPDTCDSAESCAELSTTVVGVDPARGTSLFSVPLPAGAMDWGDFIIAGDGYAYLPYATREIHESETYEDDHLWLLRVNRSGAADFIHVFDWTSEVCDILCASTSILTNGDQGTVLMFGGRDLNGAGWTRMALTNGASVSVQSAPEAPGNTGMVKPVLQAQDGSFVGVTEHWDTGSNDMVAFDLNANVRWIVPNEVPKMATEDGDVITETGVVYDQHGAVKGEVDGSLIQSWTALQYRVGSTDSLVPNPRYLALGFWMLAGANQSGSTTAIHGQWFPPLRTCTDNVGGCQTSLGPRDLLWNARNDLISQLTTDEQCSAAAQTYLFSRITYGGLFNSGFFESPVSPTEFVAYLRRTKMFYDGPKSTYDRKAAKCGEVFRLSCNGFNPPQTIGQAFQDPNAAVTAMTVTPSNPLKIFWQPGYQGPVPSNPNAPGYTGFGVGINPANFGMNIYLESYLLHEALHGLTGKYDEELQGALGIAVQDDTTNISIYIKDTVLNACPRFRR